MRGFVLCHVESYCIASKSRERGEKQETVSCFVETKRKHAFFLGRVAAVELVQGLGGIFVSTLGRGEGKERKHIRCQTGHTEACMS